MDNKIPKIIHLTWFSGEAFPEKLAQCINTWKEILPDFEIRTWTMDDAKSLNIDYVNEALSVKKWAFASDVVRAYAIWKYGGVYMDTDIWLLRRFDELMDNDLVLFHEYNEAASKLNLPNVLDEKGVRLRKDVNIRGHQIQAAFFMGKSGNAFLKDLLDYYKSIHFLNQNGKPNISVISPTIYAQVLEQYGFLYNNQEQYFDNGIKVLSYRNVAASKYCCYRESIAIHCIDHSWKPKSLKEVIWYRIKNKLKQILGVPNNAYIFKDYKEWYVNPIFESFLIKKRTKEGLIQQIKVAGQ